MRLFTFAISIAFLLTSQSFSQVVINSPPTVIPFQGSYPIEDGTILNAYEGAEIHARLGIQDGTLNLLGADLSQGVTANSGATINIYDGNISAFSDFLMSTGSTTTMRGGRFSRTLLKQLDATLIMEGVDFALNGIPIPGLASLGDEISIAIPDDTLFSGVFANGAPFTFTRNGSSGDRFYGEVILRQTSLPAFNSVVNVPADTMPTGVLFGQTLNVSTGAKLPEAMNAAPGSRVNFEGGDAGLFELNGARADVNSGNVWNLRAYATSTIHINGGMTSQISAGDDSTVVVNGGTIGTLNVAPNNDVRVNGGVVERLRFLRSGATAIMHDGVITEQVTLVGGSKFHILGGTIERSLNIPSGAEVILSGGLVAQNESASINASPGAELSLRGRQFTLGGQPILGLSQPGDSIILSDRPDQMLDAVLADGSPLSLYVGTIFPPQQFPIRDRISSLSILRLTLIPEPTTLCLAIIGIMFSKLGRCRYGACSHSEHSS